MALSERAEVLRTYCEGAEKSLQSFVQKQEEASPLRTMHLRARMQSEEDFFGLFAETAPDRSSPVFLPKGAINDENSVQSIVAARPDLIVAYGCSIVRQPLLDRFKGRLLNIHLGLSPYYRGSGTNYWPLVNGEPEFVGVTFMHMDAGIDTGEIIHQIAARIAPGDTPSAIGNRLIVDMARACRDIVARFDGLPRIPQPARSACDRYYRKADFTEASVADLYAQFSAGLIDKFLAEEPARRARAPLARNPALQGAMA